MAQYQIQCAHSFKKPVLLSNIRKTIPIAVFLTFLSSKNVSQNGVRVVVKNL